MRTHLVVAHRTLVDEHVRDHARSLAAEGSCRFHLVVPVSHPKDHAWSEGEIEAAARVRLDEGLAAFREMGLDVTGEVGDVNPVYAVATALRRRPDEDWAGIIVSTLAPGVSRWLGLDVVSRVRREFDIPVTHLVASHVASGR